MKYVYPDLPTYKPQQLEQIKPRNADVRNHQPLDFLSNHEFIQATQSKTREGSALLFETQHTRKNESDSSYEDLVQELLDDAQPAVKKPATGRKLSSVPAYADYAVATSSDSSEPEEQTVEDKQVELPARLAEFAIMSYS